jgi:hypothetical protein
VPRRHVAALGAVLLTLGGLLAACGGGSTTGSSPTDASTQDFCATFDRLQGDTPRQAARALAAVGTPSSATTANRKGFEVLVAQLKRLPDSETRVRLSTIEDNLSGERRHLVGGFVFYVQNTCMS